MRLQRAGTSPAAIRYCRPGSRLIRPSPLIIGLGLHCVLTSTKPLCSVAGMRSVRPALIIVLAFLTMTLFGGLDGLRGVSIPAVRQDLGISYNVLGITLFLSTLGFIVAIYAAGRTAIRFGLKRVLLTGLVLIGLSHFVAPVAISILPYAAMMLMLQFGGGWLEVGLNAVGAEVFTRRAAVGMSMLHLFFGLGSSGFSYIGGILISSPIGWRGAYLSALILTLPLLIYALWLRFPDTADSTSNAGHGESRGESPIRALRDPFIRRIAVLLGTVIMVEIGLGSWLANFLVAQRGLTEAASGSLLAVFWAFFTVGRLVCPFLAERFGYYLTLSLFSVGILVAFLIGFLVPGVPVALSVTGLFVSIMYPTVMAILMHRYPKNASKLMSPVLIVAVSVANLSNWLYAALHDLLGEAGGFASVGLTPVVILIAIEAVRRAGKKPQSFSSSGLSEDVSSESYDPDSRKRTSS